MGRFTRWLLALAFALPVAAYVAGSLVASSAEQEHDRGPVIVRDSGTQRPVEPTTRPPQSPPSQPDEDDDVDDIDDDEVREVDPPPHRVGDDDDDDDEEPDDDDEVDDD